MREIIINRESDVLNARVIGVKIASAMGFREINIAEIEIIISELGTNIVKHAKLPGTIIFRTVTDGNIKGIEITATDQGQWINVSAASEGLSTTGSLGIGLSGVQRLADEFDMNTENGTKIRATKWMPDDDNLQVHCSVFASPKFGEEVSGDAYFYKHLRGYAVFSVIDALGHGPEAHKVAEQVVRIFETDYRKNLPDIIENCHQALKGGRGAAVSIGKIDFKTQKFYHIGVGNVETRIYGTPASPRPSFSNGTLGMCIDRMKVEKYPYIKGACIVMYSDGISSKFDLSSDILRKTAQEICHFIFTNYAKNHDDATVLVVK